MTPLLLLAAQKVYGSVLPDKGNLECKQAVLDAKKMEIQNWSNRRVFEPISDLWYYDCGLNTYRLLTWKQSADGAPMLGLGAAPRASRIRI